MAGEIQAVHSITGRTLYALVRNSVGAVWQTTTSTFVAYVTADLANYDIALTEQGTASRFWTGPFPAAAAGVYSVVVFDRAGAVPVETDEIVAADNIPWDGTAVVSLSAVKAKTDSLTFTVAGRVDANTRSVNNVAVGGAGTSGNPWGPA